MKITMLAVLLYAALVNILHMVLFLTVPTELNDEAAQKAFAAAFENISKGNWWPAIGPIVVLLVWLVKKYDQDIPKIGPAVSKFMDNPAVSFALPFFFSAIGGVTHAIATKQPVGEAIGTVFKIAMEAVVLYVGGKKVAEQIKAGNVAAAAVEAGGKSAAIEELKKP